MMCELLARNITRKAGADHGQMAQNLFPQFYLEPDGGGGRQLSRLERL
jgi:hypothetical protein